MQRRVFRGGSWNSYDPWYSYSPWYSLPQFARSAGQLEPGFRDSYLGFRLVIGGE